MNLSNKISRGIILLLVLVVIGWVIFSLPGRRSAKLPEEKNGNGTTAVIAPDFTLTDTGGKEVRLSSLRGSKVLVNFWTTWCPHCRDEMPLIQKFNEQAAGKNWRVLAVNITNSEKSVSQVQGYIKSNNFTFSVLLDRDGYVSSLYGINSIPSSFIINEKGQVVETKMGPFSESEIEELLK